MGIPKTRKKLNQEKTGPSGSEGAPAKISIQTDEEPEGKLDEAFEIVAHMENESNDGDAPPENTEPIKQTSADEAVRPGFRWRISLEAIVPEGKRRSGHKKNALETAPLINFDFTVPFLWRTPLIGPAAKKCIDFYRGFRRGK